MKKIEFYAGCSIDKAYETLLNEAKTCGEGCFGTFNGKEIRSTETLDEVYTKLTGKTKAEFDQAQKEWKENYDRELAEDEKIRKRLINIVNGALGVRPIESEQKELIAWLEKRKEQEWREVDERIRKEIVDYLKGFIPHHDDDLVAKSRIWIAWLENLEKQKEQKPAWSEEDEDRVKTVLYILHEVADNYNFDEWLKSLKDRITLTNKNDFDRGYEVGMSAAKFNQWKPTEEQMEALKYLVDNTTDKDIESLYYDLKKL